MDILDTRNVRDISAEVLGPDGRLRILPSSYWAGVTREERGMFCAQNGIYSIPTVELVDRLREIIGERSAIEIGAGNGVLAEALGIVATDSREQETTAGMVSVALVSSGTNSPVRYGDNVIKAHASRAVRQFKPQVVIGCWVTQNYVEGEVWNGDSKLGGVDEVDIINHCETYVMVGNTKVHEGKRIWRLPHTIEHPDWLISRAWNGTPNFIAVWNGRRARGPRPGARPTR